MLAAFYQMFMNLLTMLPRTFLPIANRALVQIEGFDDRLNWTAIRQQGDDLNHHFRRMTQTIENSAARRCKGLSADFAKTALVFQTVRMNVSFSDLASCRTI